MTKSLRISGVVLSLVLGIALSAPVFADKDRDKDRHKGIEITSTSNTGGIIGARISALPHA